MKLIRFDGGATGIVIGEADDSVVDLRASLDALAAQDAGSAEALRSVFPQHNSSWIPLIEQWDQVRGALASLRELIEAGDPGLVILPMADVTLEPPLPDPASKIFALGGNFAMHVKETVGQIAPMPASISEGRAGGNPPWGFYVIPGTTVTHGAEVGPPKGIQKLDYEGEVAVVLRATGESGDVDAVRIWGFTAWNDLSIRDHVLGLSKEDHGPTTWTLPKNFETGNSVGPWLVVNDAFDVNDLDMETRVNGEVRQKANTSEMAFSFAEVTAHISQWLSLGAGDMIISGAPGGTAMESGIDGPFLEDGDIVEVEIEGVGILRNRVSFSRSTRQMVK